jgi:hypothetical protein
MGKATGFLIVANILKTVFDNQRSKKEIDRFNRENFFNRGVIEYLPCPIESFITDSEIIMNMVLSGGHNNFRSRAIVRSIDCARAQMHDIIVFHCSNHELEKEVVQLFGKTQCVVINPNNPIYDPFIGRTKPEISNLILESTTKGYEIHPSGKYYIDGISDFILAKRVNPYIGMYLTCPHGDLLDRLNDHQLKGKITNRQASLIITQIMQGELERGNIEHFFRGFANQGQMLLASSSQLQNASNIKLAVNQNKVILIDVLSNTHSLLINMLSNEIRNLLSQNRKIFLALDNMQLQSSEVLQNLSVQSGNNLKLLLSSDDVYSSFSGDDNQFYSFVGKTSKVIISKHTSAHSSQKWSDFMGTYDKYDINPTYQTNTSMFGPGSSKSNSVIIKKEQKVKPEEIQLMSVDEVYIKSNSTGEIAHATIT